MNEIDVVLSGIATVGNIAFTEHNLLCFFLVYSATSIIRRSKLNDDIAMVVSFVSGLAYGFLYGWIFDKTQLSVDIVIGAVTGSLGYVADIYATKLFGLKVGGDSNDL